VNASEIVRLSHLTSQNKCGVVLGEGQSLFNFACHSPALPMIYDDPSEESMQAF